MSERLGAVLGVVLLAAVAFLLALTLVELTERGAPWSEHGYHARRALGGAPAATHPARARSRAGGTQGADSAAAGGGRQMNIGD